MYMVSLHRHNVSHLKHSRDTCSYHKKKKLLICIIHKRNRKKVSGRVSWQIKKAQGERDRQFLVKTGEEVDLCPDSGFVPP